MLLLFAKGDQEYNGLQKSYQRELTTPSNMAVGSQKKRIFFGGAPPKIHFYCRLLKKILEIQVFPKI
jgi:hypothetical protein